MSIRAMIAIVVVSAVTGAFANCQGEGKPCTPAAPAAVEKCACSDTCKCEKKACKCEKKACPAPAATNACGKAESKTE